MFAFSFREFEHVRDRTALTLKVTMKLLLIFVTVLHLSASFPISLDGNEPLQPQNDLASGVPRAKRQFLNNFGAPFPSGGASQADAQAQGFNVKGPLGGFGASATGSQTQAIGFGPGGLSASAGLSGSQQYLLPNGQRIDVAFGNAFSNTNGSAAKSGSSAVTVTDPDGSIRNL